MKKEEIKSGVRLKESNDTLDLVRMQPEVALLESMFQSKLLTSMVVIGLLAFTGFLFFLFKVAGA